jgi:hypothetical protein
VADEEKIEHHHHHHDRSWIADCGCILALIILLGGGPILVQIVREIGNWFK